MRLSELSILGILETKQRGLLEKVAIKMRGLPL